jgi:deferrochelatase/peroxidase EfeB
MDDQLQEGIYFQSGATPLPAWRLMFLNIVGSPTPDQVLGALTGLWEMLQELKDGVVSDLKSSDSVPVRVPSDGLTCLIGYGSRLFDKQTHLLPVVHLKRPPLPMDLPVSEAHPPFPSLPWAAGSNLRQRSADIGLQFIAGTELAVNRAIVETQKYISDRRLPLQITDFFSGFGRGDKRSWIDFFDGINSMNEQDRRAAMVFTNNNDVEWMLGGTVMAFLRLEVNLEAWRKELTREQQELIVGRDKLTGCPLTSAMDDGQGTLTVTKMGGCPFNIQIPPPDFFDPPRPSHDRILLSSHIHRANPNRADPVENSSSNRIYRQGYEFLEPRPGGGLSLGLNFVSFQSDASRINELLRAEGWLGDVNFGGMPGPAGNPPNIQLLSLMTGLYFAVPPRSNPFPGHQLFA